MPPLRCPLLLAVTLVLIGGTVTPSARAESIIKRPGAHPHYVFEAEPHLVLRFPEPPGPGSGTGLGAGFRGTIELLDNGPIKKINNTMGLGFGVDWLHYTKGGRCENALCDDTTTDYYFIPVVLQWNFWLTDHWSVFGEPGIAYRWSPDTEDKLDQFVLGAGGRLHFSDRISLTMRLGVPSFSVGASFFF